MSAASGGQGTGGGAIAVAALGAGAFLLALGGALWLFAGEATFRAMVEAGAAMFCF